MKLIKVFGIVIVVHAGVFGILLFQPGCQTSTPAPLEGEVVTVVRSAENSQDQADLFAEYNGQAVNAGSSSGLNAPSTVAASGGTAAQVPAEVRLPPTRPKLMQTMRPALNPTEVSPPADVNTFVVDPLPAVPKVAVQSNTTRSAPQTESTWQDYVVKPGDSLWVLAKRSGVSVREIASHNSIKPNASLQVGQRLQLPGSPASSALQIPAPSSMVPDRSTAALSLGSEEYLVKSGDSLSRIAKRKGSSVAAIKSLNGLRSDTIKVGQKLMIPQGDGPVSAPPSVKPKVISSTANLGQDADLLSGTVSHQVSSGESLSSISKRYGVSVKELMALNDIQNSNKISLGQKLIIRRLNESPAPKPSTPAVVQQVTPVQTTPLLIPEKPEPVEIPDVSNLLVAPKKPVEKPVEEEFKEVEIIKK